MCAETGRYALRAHAALRTLRRNSCPLSPGELAEHIPPFVHDAARQGHLARIVIAGWSVRLAIVRGCWFAWMITHGAVRFVSYLQESNSANNLASGDIRTYNPDMDDQVLKLQSAPKAIIDALAESERDVAAGRTVPASAVHAMLQDAISRMAEAADLEAGTAADH